MLARLDMKLNVSQYEISYQMSSTFHGVLMELLPEEYAAELHASRRHPYAQIKIIIPHCGDGNVEDISLSLSSEIIKIIIPHCGDEL